jgi:hypothetical protein
MSNDTETIQTIKDQTLSIISQITTDPKPTYSLDGQNVSWNDYLTRLQQTVDWCDAKLADQGPFEIHSRGYS